MQEKVFLENVRLLLRELLKNAEKMGEIDHEKLNQTIIEANKRIRSSDETAQSAKPAEVEKCECKTISLDIEAGLKWCDEHDRFVSAYTP